MKISIWVVRGCGAGGANLAAYAQGLPPGSYQQSCRDFRMQGGTLTAVCRRANGRGDQLTALNVTHCVGDIGNNNGQLVCNGGQPAAPVPPPPREAQAPVYPAPGYAPAPATPPRHTGRRRAMAKNVATASGVRDYGMRSTSCATGWPTPPMARSASGCNIASAGSRPNGSSADTADARSSDVSLRPCTSHMATFAPEAENRSAIARPMPRATSDRWRSARRDRSGSSLFRFLAILWEPGCRSGVLPGSARRFGWKIWSTASQRWAIRGSASTRMLASFAGRDAAPSPRIHRAPQRRDPLAVRFCGSGCGGSAGSMRRRTIE